MKRCRRQPPCKVCDQREQIFSNRSGCDRGPRVPSRGTADLERLTGARGNANIKIIWLDFARQKPHFNTSFLCIFQSGGEFWMSFCVRQNHFHTFHLNYKSQNCLIAFRNRGGKFIKMFYATFRWSVRKISHALNFQSAALHFHKDFFGFTCGCVSFFQIKIHTRVSKSVLWLDFAVALILKPLQHDLVWRLAIDIKQKRFFPAVFHPLSKNQRIIFPVRNLVVAFFHSHQIVQSFSIGIFRFFKINSAPRNKKFSAPPCIFYVNSFFRAVKKANLGNKAIWPRKKGGGGDVVVVHGVIFRILDFLLQPLNFGKDNFQNRKLFCLLFRFE